MKCPILAAIAVSFSLWSPVSNAGESFLMWSVNGHIGRSGGFYEISKINEQMDAVVRLGVRHIRTEFYSATNEDFKLLDTILAAAHLRDIQVTPVITPGPLNPAPPPPADVAKANEDNAERIAKAFAKQFPQVGYWELGNEGSNKIMKPGDVEIDGSTEQYRGTPQHPTNYPIIYAISKGLIKGMRAGNPRAKIAFGDAGGCTFAFTIAVWEDLHRESPQLDWDITVTHPYDFWSYPDNFSFDRGQCKKGGRYSNNGLAAYKELIGKPIWFTEFNRTAAVNNNNKADMGKDNVTWMKYFNNLAHYYNVQMASMYELVDEPNLPKDAGQSERQFGILDKDGKETDGSKQITNYMLNEQKSKDIDLKGYASLRPMHIAGFCLDISGRNPGDNAALGQSPCDYSTLSQRFSLRNYVGAASQIVVQHSQKCLRAESLVNGARVVTATCGKRSNTDQLWIISRNVTDKENSIVATPVDNRGLCLSIPNMNTGVAGAQLNPCNGGPNQKFGIDLQVR